MTKISKVISVAAFASIVIAAKAGAAVIGTTGAITQIAPPTSVAPGALESDTTMFLFQERSAYQLPSSVGAEITSPTSVTGAGGTTPGTVAAGTLVNSYFLNVDSVTAGLFVTLSGTITFDQDILAVVLFGATLDPSDLVLGAAGTTYPTAGSDPLRGTAEPGVGGDVVSLSSDLRTLRITSRVFFDPTSNLIGQDQLRIITSVPEPGTLALLGLGLAGLAAVRRRKQ